MDAGSTLETIAQIAVALTGFAGIAGALAGEKLSPANPEIWLTFWAMISSSLGVLFAALFPFLPYLLGASDNITWATSSACILAFTACNLAFFMPRILRAQRDGTLPIVLGFVVPLNVSPLLVLVSQLLNVLGVGLRQSAGGFLVGLYLLLLIAALNFASLLYYLFRVRGRHPVA